MIISTIVLVLATICLAFYTCCLYREAEKTRLGQELPDICINIEPLVDELYIFVYNQGKGDASNIRIRAEPNLEFNYNDGVKKYINDISFMNLSFLRSDQFLIRGIGKYTDILNNNKNNSIIKFKIEFSSTKKIHILGNILNIEREGVKRLFEKGSIKMLFKKEYKIPPKEVLIDLREIRDGLYLSKNINDDYGLLMCATSLPIKHLLLLPGRKA